MISPELNMRLAAEDDVSAVAHVLNDVSEGVIEHLLTGVVPGMGPEKLLQMVLMRGQGTYDLNNIVLFEVRGTLAGLLFSYDAALQKVPAVMEGFIAKAKLDAVRPLLEASYPDALWINTFWVADEFRGQGLSRLMMTLAEDMARDSGKKALALHCWADNARAIRFYEKAGFSKAGVIPSGGPLLERHPAGGELWVKAVAETK